VTDCDTIRGLIGADLLGGLDEGEERELREHLATCPDCAAQHARLTRVVPLLDLAGPPLPLLLPDGLEDRLVERTTSALPPVRSRRPWLQGRRWAAPALAGALAGAVATVLLLYGIGAIGGSSPRAPQATVVQLQPTEGSPAATAVVYVIDDKGTSTIAVRASGLPAPRPGDRYSVWLSTGHGSYSAGEIYVSAGGWATAILQSRAAIAPGTSIGILLTAASARGEPPRLLVQGEVPLGHNT
jgi:anti-sigma factor RsiW